MGPASLIEVGDSSNYTTAKKVYQEPIYLSESSSQFKLDLTGLGAGPYYVWVTNNSGQISQPYTLVVPGQPSASMGRVFYDNFESGNTNLWEKDDFRNKCTVVAAADDAVLGPYAGTQLVRRPRCG